NPGKLRCVMTPQADCSSFDHFLGEFVSLDARVVARIGSETFHWFVVRRHNNYPVTVHGQFVRAESDGSISVIAVDGETSHTVAQFRLDEVEGVFEGDTPVEIRKPA